MKLANNLFFYPEKGMFDCNTYVITDGPGVIMDPGNPAFLSIKVDEMRGDGIGPGDIGFIANTHLHGDHVAANETFKELSGARIALHPVQKKHYNAVVVDAARFFGMKPLEFTEDFMLDEGTWTVGETVLEMIPAPGHSPDCVCYYNRPDRVLICGDVVFMQSTGRVDLPGGSRDDMLKSIDELSKLDVEFLLPGHMDIVDGAEHVAMNFEFVRRNVLPWL